MILFIVRRFNDIDHFAPLIYKFQKEGGHDVMVLCQNPDYNIHKDLRLLYLKNHCNADIRYIYDACKPGLARKALAYAVCGSHRALAEPQQGRAGAVLNKAEKAYEKYLHNYLYKGLSVEKYFNHDWALGLLKSLNASAVVFDFAKERQYVTGALFSAAKELGVPTFAIPPGAMMYADRVGKMKDFKDYEFPDYDHYSMQHDLRLDLTAKMGGPREKMAAMGIPRFCREWKPVLDEIVPRTISREKKEPGKLNVLYFDRPITSGMDEELTVQTIKGAANLPFINFVIKPHTRANRLGYKQLARHARVVTDVDSLELIRWADVAIGTTSSILIDVFLQGKTLLFPKYFCEYDMLVEEHGACWSVNNPQELFDALAKLAEDPQSRPYTEENVKALLTRLVYNGDYGRDVLGDHVRFIKENARKSAILGY
ncbi:hypothetical protein Dalk_1666 [Desulfatibacillum aliphaticivorans]|uniref:CDP-glycerol:poly(Glycerophosphate) glycerophosphotransferase n=1 Tax=Desulfatibacillum aliphaticivorans TaxID=218208 RepID=B8FAR8_DESAL|nr:hypothetical protein [Desulfatibacillum aliphaticivorans]ACL03364.1 hypothetical protein Dalk_1666 [Desulfatibacillum aliphaticivorans]